MSSKELNQNDIDKMTVNDLKAELKSRSGSVQGKKAELAARLSDLTQTATIVEKQQTEGAIMNESTNLQFPVASAVDLDAADDQPNQSNNETKPNYAFPPQDKKGNSMSTVIASMEDAEVQKVDEQHTINDTIAVASETETIAKPLPVARSSSSSIQDRIKEKMKEMQQQKSVLPDNSLSTNSADALDSTLLLQQTVRIDYFQRPLNIKALLTWLSELLGEEITEDRLWIHAIKTHCYLDFPTYAAAQKCIDIMSGKRYPASSTALLVANFTKVSAKEAPVAAEAALKPGEWKTILSFAPADDHKYSKRTDTAIASSSLGKRKSGSDNNTDTTKREVTTISSTLFQRATASAFRTDGIVSEAKSKRKRKEINDQDNQPEVAPLENLFRKTMARPVLYWQPVSNEVAEQRKRPHEQQK